MQVRFPNINANTPAGQLEQIRSYLYQFAEQLQWAMDSIDRATSGSSNTGDIVVGGNTGASMENPGNTFNSIKSLIIKSADIVNAYYEEINRRLEGQYVAQSDFGTYSEQTSQNIEANSTYIEQILANLQTISNTVEGIEASIINTNAYIKSGLLDYADDGTPLYGLEVGQRNEIDGVETFDKFARFTADRLSFYDQNDTEVAYISDYKLFITHAEITGSLTLGGYFTDLTDGIAYKWIGG